MKTTKSKLFKYIIYGISFVFCIILAIKIIIFYNSNSEEFTSSSFAMNTIVTQIVYADSEQKAQNAAREVENELLKFEKTISMYISESDIFNINKNAGLNSVQVSLTTIELLKQAKELSINSDNAFALTIAPLVLEWGITSSEPKIPQSSKIEELLLLVDDTQITINENENTIKLENKDQAIDLGGIAKGYACNIAHSIYSENGVQSALLSIGGNIYSYGTKPDGSLFRIGFKNPNGDEQMSAIASVEIENAVFSVSGGYERYFEEDNITYHHIIDPTTGYPSNSDLLSVGIIHSDGTIADFYSTSLFVKGSETLIDYFENGGTGMALDLSDNLYVSANLKNSFELIGNDYNVIYIEQIN